MIDIRILRANPDQVRKAIELKKFECDLEALLEIDRLRRVLITRAETARAKQKKANAEMAKMERDSAQFHSRLKEMKSLSQVVKGLQGELQEIESKWEEKLRSVPNLPHETVPEGESEEDNLVVRSWGEPEEVSALAKPHYEIPGFESAVDFESGTRVTGAGFPFFVGNTARFVRALISFFLDEAMKAGYTEVHPPLLVNAESAMATGQLPDKEKQMYELEGDRFFLIPTAEVPITNLLRGKTVQVSELPVRMCGYTPNFRREAGSYGKDVRGLNRVHQFDKVELVNWVQPESSYDELEDLLNHAEGLLKKLELPYRVLLMCAGEIGFPHAKQYDLEVWCGGQKRWMEVSSCSNFTDFQARRAGIHFRAENGDFNFVHTLNGSALALPRTLAALFENNLLEDGSIKVPESLQEYFREETLKFT